MTREEIKRAVKEVLPQVIDLRRLLHSHPELSFREYETSALLAARLTEARLNYRSVAETGIIATLGSGRNAVVLRADIDALPITEQTGLPYSSARNGVMHACGHDMHAAALYGALLVLSRNAAKLNCTVLGLFQPGEELCPGGALKVLNEKPFDDYDIKAFFGAHIEPALETGTFGFCSGPYMAANDELRIRLTGRGGHAALRDKIRDPVQAAAAVITALHEMSERVATEDSPVVLSIGKIVAEGATNIVPDEVCLEGTVRTFDERLRQELKTNLIQKSAATAAEPFSVTVNIDIADGYPVVVNEPALTERAAGLTRAFFGSESVVELSRRMTSEDFGWYTKTYPSLFYRFGAGGNAQECLSNRAGSLHSPHFTPDEKALEYAVTQMINLVHEFHK